VWPCLAVVAAVHEADWLVQCHPFFLLSARWWLQRAVVGWTGYLSRPVQGVCRDAVECGSTTFLGFPGWCGGVKRLAMGFLLSGCFFRF
jgi:hypothetical protein